MQSQYTPNGSAGRAVDGSVVALALSVTELLGITVPLPPKVGVVAKPPGQPVAVIGEVPVRSAHILRWPPEALLLTQIVIDRRYATALDVAPGAGAGKAGVAASL